MTGLQMTKAKFLTVDEVAELLRVDPRTVYRDIEKGKIPGIRVGRLWRVPRRVVDQMIESEAIYDLTDEEVAESKELSSVGSSQQSNWLSKAANQA